MRYRDDAHRTACTVEMIDSAGEFSTEIVAGDVRARARFAELTADSPRALIRWHYGVPASRMPYVETYNGFMSASS